MITKTNNGPQFHIDIPPAEGRSRHEIVMPLENALAILRVCTTWEDMRTLMIMDGANTRATLVKVAKA